LDICRDTRQDVFCPCGLGYRQAAHLDEASHKAQGTACFNGKRTRGCRISSAASVYARCSNVKCRIQSSETLTLFRCLYWHSLDTWRALKRSCRICYARPHI
jgi:hypothetical protein